MPAPWSAKGAKTSIVGGDQFMILDSQDGTPATQNKRVSMSLVKAFAQTPWVVDVDAANHSLSNLSSLSINDSAADNTFTISSSVDLASDRIINLPLLLANDTFVFENFIQDITNKTFTGTTNQFENTALRIEDTTGTPFIYTIKGSSLDANYTVTIPDLTADDTFALLGISNTFTATQFIFPTIGPALVLSNASAPIGSGSPFTSTFTSTATAVGFVGAQTGDFFSWFINSMPVNSDTASVIPEATTLTVAGPPTAGTNVTITNSNTLHIQSGLSRFDGNIQVGSASTINDSGGNELIVFPTTVASAVNQITISNAITAVGPTITSSGESNIDLNIAADGTGSINFLDDVVFSETLVYTNATGTIAAGVLPAPTVTYQNVAGQGGVADDLDTITAGTTGQYLIIKPSDGAVTITVTTAGNIVTIGGNDFVMNDIEDTMTLIYDGTNWIEISRNIPLADTPWTVNHDAAGFNLINLGLLNQKIDDTTAVHEMEANHTTPANGQIIGQIDFIDDDDGGTRTTYGKIRTLIENPVDFGGEDGEMFLSVIKAGTLKDYISINEGNNNRIVVNTASIQLDTSNAISFDGAFANQTITGSGAGITFAVPNDDDFIFNEVSTELIKINDLEGLVASRRIQEIKGADVDSSAVPGTLTLVNGNYFDVTGTTTTNFMTTTNWQGGSTVTLQFTGILTINHDASTPPANTAPFKLIGATSFTTAAGNTLTVTFDGTDWIEIGRNASIPLALTNGSVLIGDETDMAKAYTAHLEVKLDCRLATTTTIDVGVGGLLIIDSVQTVAADRILVKDQGIPSQNGIYVAAVGAWSRSTDADTSGEVNNGMFTNITEGTVNADTAWILTTPDSITLATTGLLFNEFSFGDVAHLNEDQTFTQTHTFASFSDTASEGSFFNSVRGRGTTSSPDVVELDDVLGGLSAQGQFISIAGSTSVGGTANFVADGTWTIGSTPARFELFTHPTGLGSLTKRFEITADGTASFVDNSIIDIASILLNDVDDSHAYTILGGALAGDFNVTIPGITASDTFALLGVAQTFTESQSILTSTTTSLGVGGASAPTGSGIGFVSAFAIVAIPTVFVGAQTGEYSSSFFASINVSSNIASVIPNAATLQIEGAPVAGTNVTITENSALHVKAGLSIFDGNIQVASASSINDSNGNELILFPTVVGSALNQITISNAATGVGPTITSSGESNIDLNIAADGTGNINLLDGVLITSATGTTDTDLILTTPTAPLGSGSEFIANLSSPDGTVAFATTDQTGDFFGTKLGIQTLTNPTNPETIVNAATLRIVGAPVASTNVTITNNAALHVVAGLSRLDGNIQVGSASTINDSNGNELIIFPTAIGSALNEITISNAITTVGPTITSSGETNVDLNIATAGTGNINLLATTDMNTNSLVNVFGVEMNGRLQQARSTVSSGDVVTLGDANSFVVSGTTTMNHMTNTGWQSGAIVILLFTDILTVTSNAGGATGTEADFDLKGNFVTADGSVLTLIYDGSIWQEISRAV